LSNQVDNATEVSSAVIRTLRGARALFDSALALDAAIVLECRQADGVRPFVESLLVKA
jgi:hypothetical protein